jgi:hypothetical protein
VGGGAGAVESYKSTALVKKPSTESCEREQEVKKQIKITLQDSNYLKYERLS